MHMRIYTTYYMRRTYNIMYIRMSYFTNGIFLLCARARTHDRTPYYTYYVYYAYYYYVVLFRFHNRRRHGQLSEQIDLLPWYTSERVKDTRARQIYSSCVVRPHVQFARKKKSIKTRRRIRRVRRVSVKPLCRSNQDDINIVHVMSCVCVFCPSLYRTTCIC